MSYDSKYDESEDGACGVEIGPNNRVFRSIPHGTRHTIPRRTIPRHANPCHIAPPHVHIHITSCKCVLIPMYACVCLRVLFYDEPRNSTCVIWSRVDRA